MLRQLVLFVTASLLTLAAPITSITVTGSGTWIVIASDSIFEAYGVLSGTALDGSGRSFSMSGTMDWQGAGLSASHHGGAGCTIDGLRFDWMHCQGSFSGLGGTFTGYSADFRSVVVQEELIGVFTYTSNECQHGLCGGTWQVAQHMPEPTSWLMIGSGLGLAWLIRTRFKIL